MSGATLLFETTVGTCGIAWGEHGILAVQLPETTTAATRRRLSRGLPALAEWATGTAPPPAIGQAIEGIVALLRGEPRHLRDLVLDMTRIPPFHRRVYDLARGIDPGQTLTYGEVAHRLDEPGAARAVGQALGSNPFVIVVPCHRVMAAQGRAGGFSAPGGTRTKLRLLAIEGVFSRPAEPGETLALF